MPFHAGHLVKNPHKYISEGKKKKKKNRAKNEDKNGQEGQRLEQVLDTPALNHPARHTHPSIRPSIPRRRGRHRVTRRRPLGHKRRAIIPRPTREHGPRSSSTLEVRRGRLPQPPPLLLRLSAALIVTRREGTPVLVVEARCAVIRLAGEWRPGSCHSSILVGGPCA